MISFFEATLSVLSVHRIGNKTMDEFYVLSEQPTVLNQEESSMLMPYFLNPFHKANEVYNLYHPSGNVRLNVVHELVDGIFTGKDFHSATRQLAVHLYEQCNNPKIKSGELYIAYFENIQIDGECRSAVGIFKSESKENYLTVSPRVEGFHLNFEQNAINLQSVDKGCLIFNDNTFKVVCLDEKTKDGSYWKDEFLSLKVVNDQYQQTTNMISLCQNFIKDQLDQDFEISHNDKADLLNKSHHYFKEKESFDLDEYTQEVLNNDQAKESFKKYKSIYDEDFDTNIPSCFNISPAAVKKQASKFKSIIKLDKNFHIYVHGSKDLIEKGFDEEKSMNYYKVFFKEESI